MRCLRRLLTFTSFVVACSSPALAQTATPGSYIVAPGASTNLTLSGTAGQSYAVIASRTSGGFSYAGVNLAVGLDVAVLTVGTLDGAGSATVSVTPPFPTVDRYYVQAVFSSDGFGSITPSNSVSLLNLQEARQYMPVGGIVSAAGALQFGSPGITVTRTGVGVYRIDTVGQFAIPSVIPSVTPAGNATVVTVSTNAAVTTVTLSADANFFFTLQPVRR